MSRFRAGVGCVHLLHCGVRVSRVLVWEDAFNYGKRICDPLLSPLQSASKVIRAEVNAVASADEICDGDREKEEPPSPIEATPPRSLLEKVSKKKTPKTVKMPKPSKIPKSPKSPKPSKAPKALKLKDGGKKKGRKCRESASPTIPNLDLLEAHTKEALTKMEPPKKSKVGPPHHHS